MIQNGDNRKANGGERDSALNVIFVLPFFSPFKSARLFVYSWILFDDGEKHWALSFYQHLLLSPVNSTATKPHKLYVRPESNKFINTQLRWRRNDKISILSRHIFRLASSASLSLCIAFPPRLISLSLSYCWQYNWASGTFSLFIRYLRERKRNSANSAFQSHLMSFRIAYDSGPGLIQKRKNVYCCERKFIFVND